MESYVTGDWLKRMGAYAIPTFGSGRVGLAIRGHIFGRQAIFAFYPDSLHPVADFYSQWAFVCDCERHEWLPNCKFNDDDIRIAESRVTLVWQAMGFVPEGAQDDQSADREGT